MMDFESLQSDLQTCVNSANELESTINNIDVSAVDSELDDAKDKAEAIEKIVDNLPDVSDFLCDLKKAKDVADELLETTNKIKANMEEIRSNFRR